MIDGSRLVELAVTLSALPGLPGQEEAVSEFVEQYLGSRGLRVDKDRAGRALGGETGNLHVRLPGRAELPRLLFSAHLDVAKPPACPQLQQGVLRVPGGYFAADDRIGLALLLALADHLLDESARGQVELLLTIAEEAGLVGVRQISPGTLDADCAFVLDGPGTPGSVAIQGDAAEEFRITVLGRPPRQGHHAGPEARWVVNRAIARLPVGQIDQESTLEFLSTAESAGDVLLSGVVYAPDERGIGRILESVRVLFRETVTRYGLGFTFQTGRAYPGYRHSLAATPVGLAVAAAKHVLLKPILLHQRGASDANILNMLGLPAVNLGAGWHEGPNGEVWVYPEELQKTLEYLIALVNLAATRPGWRERGGIS